MVPVRGQVEGSPPGLEQRTCGRADRTKVSNSSAELADVRVDLSSTALDSLKSVTIEDLKRFEWKKTGKQDL